MINEKLMKAGFLKNLLKRHLQGNVKQFPTTVGTSNEKYRFQWVVEKLSQLDEGWTILDAGAGQQPFKRYCSHLNYVSQDFGKYNPADLEKGLQQEYWEYGKLDIVSDVTSIPKSNESFDAILCTEVFEHIVNPMDAVREFARLLKEGGKLILSSPFCSLTHFAPFHFYSGFNKFFYQEVLTNNGFDIKEIISNGNYFEYLAQELRRLPSVGNKYGGIKLSGKECQNIDWILNTLEKLSSVDSGSSELLCFGYQILAVRK